MLVVLAVVGAVPPRHCTPRGSKQSRPRLRRSRPGPKSHHGQGKLATHPGGAGVLGPGELDGLLLGGGLAVLGLLGSCPGPSTPAGRQGLAAGHVLGHIGQPPGGIPGRPPQPLKGGLGVQLLAAHDDPFGLLDQPPVLQGGLQLISQPPLDLGGHRRHEQAGHQPGIGLEGRDLAGIPVPRLTGIDVQGVPMTPPSSSTGTLKAAQIPSLTSTWVNSCQSGSVRRSRMAAGSRWLNATAHGPLASRSCPSSTLWAVWSEALAQRSCPSWSTSISPAPSAPNSCLAPSVTCCRVGPRPCCGFRLSRAPMLWASSEGSIGMATPAFLLPCCRDWRAGQQT